MWRWRRYVIHYVGQYLWLGVVIAAGAAALGVRIEKEVGPIVSRTYPAFNSSAEPFWFVHVSDTHCNEFNGRYCGNLRRALNASLMYRASVLVHTGDIVDNFGSDTRPKYGHQHEPDWVVYNVTMAQFRGVYDKILGNAGNHDMFGVWSFESPRFGYKMYSGFANPMGTLEEFQVSKYHVGEYTFIALNPFRFPTVHPCLMYWVTPQRSFLDRLERVVESCGHDEKLIFTSHYPQSFYKATKASSGRTFHEIIGDNRTVAFLSGHIHPMHPHFEHHRDYLESIAVDIKSHRMFGVATLDNNRFVYHEIDPEQPNRVLVTYPVPFNQTTAQSGFNDITAPIRILSFTDQPLNVTISGNVITNVRMIRKGVYLYEHPIPQMTDGLHHITLGGDCSGEIEFYTGSTIPKFRELKNSEYNLSYLTFVATPILFCLLVFVTCPIRCCSSSYLDWMNDNNTKSHWFLTITGLCMRAKLQKLPLRHRLILFLFVLWPVCLPMALMETEDHIGFIWAYGYVINNTFSFAERGLHYVFFYLTGIILPVALSGASQGAGIPFIVLGLLETSSLYLASTCATAWIWYHQLTESVGLMFACSSLYTLSPLILFPISLFSYSGLLFHSKPHSDITLLTHDYSELALAP